MAGTNMTDAVEGLKRVISVANWAFGSEELARQFLDLPNPELGGRVPRVIAATDAGAREVEAVLNRFAFGDYS